MEQLPVEHRGGPRQPEAGRGLRGRDARLRGAHHQGPQGRPLRLQQLLQAHIQGQFFKPVDEFVTVCLPVVTVMIDQDLQLALIYDGHVVPVLKKW